MALALLLLLGLPAISAQDACLLGPWQAGGAAPALKARAVTVASLADLQRFIDEAAGPTALLVRAAAAGPLSSGGRTLVIDKPDVAITAAAAYEPGGAFKGQRIAVACGAAKTLVAIRCVCVFAGRGAAGWCDAGEAVGQLCLRQRTRLL